MKVGGKGDILVTHALGSCLGLMVYDPVERVGGLLHAMLPLSKINPQKAKTNPFMFVDTGVPKLFEEIYSRNGQKRRLVVKVAGCSRPLGKNEKKLLWKNNILLDAEDIGGTDIRTVHFDLSTGRTIIKCKGPEREL